MKRFLSLWLPVAAWCFLIFYLSGVPSLGTGWGIWDLILRKGAHMTEYAVLFLLMNRALSGTLGRSSAAITGTALIAAVLYAVSDEYHQSFVPGRVASAVDVLIDSAGAACGLLLYRRSKQS